MTAPMVLFPNAEALVAGYLRTALPAVGLSTVFVATTTINRPSEMVLVQRLGGPKLNMVADEPLIGFESWAPTKSRSRLIMANVRMLINALRGSTLSGHAVYRVQEAAGEQYLPDPTVPTLPRYIWNATIAIRGQGI